MICNSSTYKFLSPEAQATKEIRSIKIEEKDCTDKILQVYHAVPKSNALLLSTVWGRLGMWIKKQPSQVHGQDFRAFLRALNDLMNDTLKKVTKLDCRSTANIIQSLACFILCSDSKMQDTRFHELTEQQQAYQLIEGLKKRTIEISKKMNAIDLSIAAWAFAKLKQTDKNLVLSLRNRAKIVVGEMDVQKVTNLGWAFATFNHQNEEFNRCLTTRLKEVVHQMGPKEVAHTAWTLATLQHVDIEFMQALAKRAQTVAPKMTPQAIANILWAFGILDYYDEDLIHALGSRAIQVVDKMNAQEIANALWALAKLGYTDTFLLKTLATHVLKIYSKMKPKEISMTLWAFAKLHYYDAQLLERLSTRAEEIVHEMNEHELANTAWALATVNHPHTSLVQALSTRVQQTIHHIKLQGIANLLWAFARLHYDHPAIFSSMFEVICREENSLNVEERLCLLTAADYCLCKQWSLSDSTRKYLDSLEKGISQGSSSSSLHQSVSNILTTMGCEASNEQRIGYSLIVDICLDSHKLVIEVDGPIHDHYVRKQRDAFKTYLLEKKGYTVKRVTYRQWNALKGETEKKEFLTKLVGFSGQTQTTPVERKNVAND